MAMTLKQKKALALATARGRLGLKKEQTQQPLDEYMAANAQIATEPEEASFLESMGRGMTDVYQGGKQLAVNIGAATGLTDQATADEYNRKVNEELGLFNKNNPGIQAGRIAGNIATPLSLLPFAAGSGAVRAASVPFMGGLLGAAQPVENPNDFAKQKLAQTGIGALAAPLLPLGGKAVGGVASTLGNFASPLFAKGRTKAIEQILRSEAGDDTGRIVSALQNTPQGNPTSAQAIAAAARQTGEDFGSPLVRLEKDLAREGIAGQQLRSRYAEQAIDRKSRLGQIAGSPERMADAVSRRASAADPYYKAVEDSVKNVNTGNISTYIDDVVAKAPNEPGVTGPLKWIQNKMATDTTPKALHSLSRQIKIMAQKKNPAGQSLYNKTVLGAVKDRLDTAIGQTEDSFRMAQKIYAKGSRPINQMKVGKELAYALENALETESPASFANAIRNAPRTIKKATNVGVYENLSDILKPKQLEDVQNVLTELMNQKQQSLMERSVRPIFSDIKTGIEPRLPRLLERSVVIANAALRKLGVDKADEYHKEIISILMEPEKLVQVLQRPQSDKTRQVAMEIVNKLSSQIPAQTAGRAAGEDNR